MYFCVPEKCGSSSACPVLGRWIRNGDKIRYRVEFESVTLSPMEDEVEKETGRGGSRGGQSVLGFSV